MAIAIIQHPAVQKVAKEIGEVGLRKAQEWWKARKALKLAVEQPKMLRKKKTAKTTSQTAKAKRATAKRKTSTRKSPTRKMP